MKRLAGLLRTARLRLEDVEDIDYTAPGGPLAVVFLRDEQGRMYPDPKRPDWLAREVVRI